MTELWRQAPVAEAWRQAPTEPTPEQTTLAGELVDHVTEQAVDFGLRTVAGGINDAGRGLWNTLVSVAALPVRPAYTAFGGDEEYFEQQVEDMRRWAQPIPRPNSGIVNELTREIVRFGAGYLSTGGPMAGAAGFTGTMGKGLVGGGITDFAFYGPNEPRASNIAEEFYPNPVTGALAATGEDSELVGRLKNVAEGGILGMTFDTLARTIGRIAGRRGINPNTITVDDLRAAAEAGDVDAAALVDSPAVRNAMAMTEDAAAPPPPRTRHGPRDLVSWLRQQGGIQDQGGEMAAMGIDNTPRQMDFARDEQFLGHLIRPDGLDLDTATRMAWEAGFLEGAERPDIDTLVQAIGRTANAENIAQRTWRRGDIPDITALKGRDLAEESAFYGIDPEGLSDLELALEIDRVASLVEGRSTPASTLADLETRAPVEGEILSRGERTTARVAANAGEEAAETATGMAGNINLRNIQGEADIGRVLRRIEKTHAETLDEARRGRVSQEETIQVARDMGMTVEDLMNRRRGEAFNSEQAFAARELLAESADELVRLSQLARAGGDENLIAFQQALTRHVAIQESVAGMTAEAGRALAQFNIMAQSGKARERALRELLEAQGRGGNIQEMAGMVSDLAAANGDIGALSGFVRDASRAGTLAKVQELWINALLSNPATHVVNMSSNLMTNLLTLPENAVAAMFGSMREAQTGTIDRVYMAETLARIRGMGQGTVEGLSGAWQTLRTNELDSAFAKIEIRQGAIPGVIGDIIRTPGRLLNTEDAFFKSLAGRMELNALATRQAIGEGLSGTPRARRVRELLANPPQELLDASKDFANYITFTNQLGGKGQAVSHLLSEAPALRFIVPFLRTPTNIIKFAAERTPFGFLMKHVRDNFAAGGATQDIATARMMTGTGLMMAAGSMAQNGTLTGGGPSDPALRSDLYATGWQPYSLRVGDTYYSYQRFEPAGMLMGVAADFVQLQDEIGEAEADNIAALIMGSMSQNLLSKTWMTNVSNAINAVSRPDQYGEKFINRMAGSLVPAGIAQIARIQDPALRDAQSWIDSIYARIPGMSEDLPYRLNVWGEPIIYEGSLGPDIISPIYTSTHRNDPLMDEVVRLQMGLRMPQRQIRGVALDPFQYGQYVQIAGSTAKQALTTITQTPQYQAMADSRRRLVVNQTINTARSMAREQMMATYPEIAQQAIQQQIETVQ